MRVSLPPPGGRADLRAWHLRVFALDQVVSRGALDGTAYASCASVPSSTSPQDQSQNATGSEGAVPPTGGVPPEDSPAASRGPAPRSAADDLVDGIDLMLRAARKALRTVEPRIEQAAERALHTLQEIDEKAAEPLRRQLSAIDPKRLETLANEAGREIASLVERIANRVESELGRSPK